jgi:hypothetical protein
MLTKTSLRPAQNSKFYVGSSQWYITQSGEDVAVPAVWIKHGATETNVCEDIQLHVLLRSKIGLPFKILTNIGYRC